MPELDRDEIVRAAYEIPGQTWPVELGTLFELARQARSYVEVGTYCGRSLFVAACAMLPGGRAVGVDSGLMLEDCPGAGLYLPRPGWAEEVLQATLRAIRDRRPDVTVVMERRDSLTAAGRLVGPHDLIFLDGGHTWKEVEADIGAWLPRVAPGGVLCGHDYWPGHPGVMDAVNGVLRDRFEVLPNTRIWLHRRPR